MPTRGIYSDVTLPYLTLPYTHTSWDISTALFSFSLMLSLRASSKQTFSFSIHFSLLHTYSFLCFFCLARCSFKFFPNFRWDALWGILSDVTLPYLTLPYGQILNSHRCSPNLVYTVIGGHCTHFCLPICDAKPAWQELIATIFGYARAFVPNKCGLQGARCLWQNFEQPLLFTKLGVHCNRGALHSFLSSNLWCKACLTGTHRLNFWLCTCFCA